MTSLRTVLLLALLALPGWSAEPGLKSFTDITGRTHTPFAAKETKAVVFLFVSIDCPIANFYQPTLRRLAGQFTDQGVLFFQVHSDPDLTLEAAAKHAREFEVTSPVLLDSDQTLARACEAKITPEAIVLNGAGRTVYRGRIDNTYSTYGKRRPEPTSRDLEAALTATVAGKRVAVPVTEAVGCTIFLEPK